jgi:hypothetical protein
MDYQSSISHEKWVLAVAAVAYATEIIAQTQRFSDVSGVDIATHACRHLAGIRPEETAADLQAIVVERELADLAPDNATFFLWHAAAGLIDVGARPLLSERAADAIAQFSIASVIGK